MAADYFEFLGLPRNLAIDGAELEKRFYALSRQLHPDLHSRKGPEARQQAEDSTALLNDAFRTLRDPVRRAEYLLKLEGLETGEQTSKDVPSELLEEVFEFNMALEELKNGDADALPELDAARRRFEAMREEIDADLQAKFSEWDSGRDRATLSGVRALLNRRKYISNLIAQAAAGQDESIQNVSNRI